METGGPTHILDASVAIDLVNGNLIEAITRLPYKIGIPDVILDIELKTYSEFHSEKYTYVKIEYAGHQIDQVIQLETQTKSVSTPDLFAFISATYYSCCLVTGDNNLRKLAESRGVTVHGTLWILDELILYRILSPIEAAEVLRQILNSGSRLPQEECDRRFKRWKQ